MKSPGRVVARGRGQARVNSAFGRGERANAAASLLCGHAGSIPFSVAKDSTFLACCFAAIIPAYNAESVVFIIPFTGGHLPSAGGVDQPTTQAAHRNGLTEAAIDFKERAHAVSYDLAAPSSTDEELLT
jgi:hypothetical protein